MDEHGWSDRHVPHNHPRPLTNQQNHPIKRPFHKMMGTEQGETDVRLAYILYL